MWFLDDIMAPPLKRRRLSGSAVSPSPSRTTPSSTDPTPSFAHSVESIAGYPSPSLLPQPGKQHIQEIHLQIQERAVISPHHYFHHYPRRQDGTVTLVSSITTVDAAGNTIVSLVTNTLPTVTTPITTTTSSPTSSSTTDSIVGPISTSTTTSTTSNSTSSISSTGTGTGTGSSTQASGSFTSRHNGTTTAHSTGTTTSKDTSVYMTTLTNGDEKTLTRSDKPYVTTFADGEHFTVCDRQGDCKLSTQNSNSQSTFSQALTMSNSVQLTTTSTAFIAGGGSPPTASPSPTSSSNNTDDSTPPAGAIAGGVVGGAAGLAVILLIALMFFKWYKRRQLSGHQALNPTASSLEDDPTFSRSGPGMAERAGIMPLVSAVPAFFRHSGHNDAPPPAAERGFTRVSGRKLPSQFSAGIGGPAGDSPRSPPPDMPLAAASGAHDRSLSDTSFYRDSNGFYGGTGTNVSGNPDSPSPAELHGEPSPSNSMERGSPSPPVEIALSPGPRRTPTVHHGGPYVISPSSSVPATPTVPPIPARYNPGPSGVGRGMPVRSETPSSYGEERGSRFMEEV